MHSWNSRDKSLDVIWDLLFSYVTINLKWKKKACEAWDFFIHSSQILFIPECAPFLDWKDLIWWAEPHENKKVTTQADSHSNFIHLSFSWRKFCIQTSYTCLSVEGNFASEVQLLPKGYLTRFLFGWSSSIKFYCLYYFPYPILFLRFYEFLYRKKFVAIGIIFSGR